MNNSNNNSNKSYYFSLIFTLILLTLSVSFNILIFILPNWLLVTQTLDNYGVWQACKANSFECYAWYTSGQAVFNYNLSASFKAFQGLQTFELSLAIIAVALILLNQKCFPRLNSIHFLIAVLILMSASCGTASLAIFGIRIYDSTAFSINWCFWVSVACIVLCCLSVILFAVFLYTLKEEEKLEYLVKIEPSLTLIKSVNLRKRSRASDYINKNIDQNEFKFMRPDRPPQMQQTPPPPAPPHPLPNSNNSSINYTVATHQEPIYKVPIIKPSAPIVTEVTTLDRSQLFKCQSMPALFESLDIGTQTSNDAASKEMTSKNSNNNEDVLSSTIDDELENTVNTTNGHFHYHSEYDFSSFKQSYDRVKRQKFSKNPNYRSNNHNYNFNQSHSHNHNLNASKGIINNNNLKRNRMVVQINDHSIGEYLESKNNPGLFYHVVDKSSGYNSEPESYEIKNRTWISVVNEDSKHNNFYLKADKTQQHNQHKF